MTRQSLKILTIALLFVALATGCGKQESKQVVIHEEGKPGAIHEESKQEVIPEATDKTCTLENQKKFGPAFADKCMYSGKYKKSSGRTW